MAHGDHVGGQSSAWEPQNGKRERFLMRNYALSANRASLSEQGQNGKAQEPSHVGELEDHGEENVKVLKYKGRTRALETSSFDRGALE